MSDREASNALVAVTTFYAEALARSHARAESLAKLNEQLGAQLAEFSKTIADMNRAREIAQGLVREVGKLVDPSGSDPLMARPSALLLRAIDTLDMRRT